MYIPSGIVEGVRVVKGLTAFMGLLIDQVIEIRGYVNCYLTISTIVLDKIFFNRIMAIFVLP